MERVAVSLRLKPGAEAQAKQLLAAGPPFDPALAGLDRHAVYLGDRVVVFVFEGPAVERHVESLANDRLQSASFAAWAELLADQPQFAHEAYHWESAKAR
jgi:hypothetical protein